MSKDTTIQTVALPWTRDSRAIPGVLNESGRLEIATLRPTVCNLEQAAPAFHGATVEIFTDKREAKRLAAVGVSAMLLASSDPLHLPRILQPSGGFEPGRTSLRKINLLRRHIINQ